MSRHPTSPTQHAVMGSRIRARSLLLTLTVALVAPGCAVHGLSFVADHRVKILEPRESATVVLPIEVAWSVEDFEGSFAVFFDRSPIRPSQSLRSLVPENDPCLAETSCPDAGWLAERNIYVTEGTSLVIEFLPDRRDSNRSKDRHDVTIVLLDERGQREGESAFTTEFVVARQV